jgi:hypothetical protein
MNRRKFLAGASAAVVGLAGCVSNGGTDNDDGNSGDGGNQDDNPGDGDNGSGDGGNGDDGSGDGGNGDDGTGDGDDGNGDDGNSDDASGDGIDLPDGVSTASIPTANTDCGTSDADRFDAELGETVTINGTLSAPNPCHEAVFSEITLEGGELGVTIDVEDTSGDTGCVECIGEVSYEATIELDDVEVTKATLTHVTGGTYTIEGSRTYPNPTVTDTAIEMVGAECGTEDDATANIEPGEEAVEITGTVIASNPCHRAVLSDVTVDGSKLDVEVGLEETETDVCESCTGAISYEATVTIEEMKGLNTVSVSHPDGSSYGASWRSSSTSARDPESN